MTDTTSLSKINVIQFIRSKIEASPKETAADKETVKI
jgi:hypothetical protein